MPAQKTGFIEASSVVGEGEWPWVAALEERGASPGVGRPIRWRWTSFSSRSISVPEAASSIQRMRARRPRPRGVDRDAEDLERAAALVGQLARSRRPRGDLGARTCGR
jgi:hypothetical protein